jgi:uroporphyrinogen-III synthase
VLVGRARHQASALSAGLRRLGAEVLEIPFIEIHKPQSYQALDAALKNLSQYDWLILTSVNGVDAVWARLKKLGLGHGAADHLKIAAIGPATGKAIESQGAEVTAIPKEYVAESVVASLRRRVKGKRVLLARAKVARDVIPRELRRLGAAVDVVEAYETVVPQSSRNRVRSALQSSRLCPDVIAFTSSSTVRNFAELLNERGHSTAASLRRGLAPDLQEKFKRIRFASIGPITSSTLRELGLPVDVEAKVYTIPGLVEAIAESGRSPAE